MTKIINMRREEGVFLNLMPIYIDIGNNSRIFTDSTCTGYMAENTISKVLYHSNGEKVLLQGSIYRRSFTHVDGTN